jgi:GT2 family glycosyltransferase
MAIELLSASICTRNRPDLVGQAVGSVLKNTAPAFELIIIDQSDGTATWDALAEFHGDPRLRYHHTTRVGLSAAYNAAIREARGALLAFTDDDCVAPPDWISSIRAEFEAEPDVSLLYGQVLMPDEFIGVPGYVPTLPVRRRRVLSKKDGFHIFGMGANYAARRSLFDDIGLFDEALGGGGPLRSSQDFDLMYRAYRAGKQTLLSPSVSVLHYGHRTNEEWPLTETAYGIGDGAFYMKHMRCGDFQAAHLFAKRFGREAAKAAIKPLLGKPNSTRYLRGMVRGSRDSFRFPVNKASRQYVLPKSGA